MKIEFSPVSGYLLKEYDAENNLLASYSFSPDIWTINGDWIDKCFSSISKNENGYQCVLYVVYDNGSGSVIETRRN